MLLRQAFSSIINVCHVKKAPSYRKRPKRKILELIRTKVFESFLKNPPEFNKMHRFCAGSEKSGFPGHLNLEVVTVPVGNSPFFTAFSLRAPVKVVFSPK